MLGNHMAEAQRTNVSFKQINENKVWKESFASSAKDAQLDMLDYKNNIIVNENTNLPRFDLFIWGCIERFKVS